MNGSGCDIELPRYNEVNPDNKYDLNPIHPYNPDQLSVCMIPELCGCPLEDDIGWGSANDCSNTACEAACDLVSNSPIES